MNPRYSLWMLALNKQDLMLVMMALMAWSVVAAWLLIDRIIPEDIRPAARLWLGGTIILIYAYTIYQAVIR